MNEHDIPMNLQLFAEGEPTPETPAAAGTADAQTAPEEQAQPRTFTQEEVDQIVNQRLARQRRETERQVSDARQQGRTEAERLARMTEEERARHDREEAENAARQRESNLAAREAEITRRELRAEARDTLSQRGLPLDLADMLDYSGADACSASISVLEKAFRKAVQTGVDERLRASGVRLRTAGSEPDYDSMTDAEYFAATYKK